MLIIEKDLFDESLFWNKLFIMFLSIILNFMSDASPLFLSDISSTFTKHYQRIFDELFQWFSQALAGYRLIEWHVKWLLTQSH